MQYQARSLILEWGGFFITSRWTQSNARKVHSGYGDLGACSPREFLLFEIDSVAFWDTSTADMELQQIRSLDAPQAKNPSLTGCIWLSNTDYALTLKPYMY